MTHKGLSIRMDDFSAWVPNGTWIRQSEGATPRNVTLPIEGILSQDIAANPWYQGTLQADAALTVTPISGIDTVRLYAGQIEYKIDGEWIDFRELCIRTIERRLKETMSLTSEAIGTHLYHVATWIERGGNRGYSDEDLMINVPAFPIRLLNPEYRPHWQDILFFGEGGDRRDYSGWGVHKRTPAHWSVTWLARFGLDHPQAEDLMTAAWDEAHVEHEKQAVKRIHQTYAGVDLEQAETCDVAHKAAVMWLLSQWADARAWSLGGRREMWRLQSEVYHAAYKVFRHELLYRMDQQPEKRRSKKKTQAARDDWATASTYFTPSHGFAGPREFAVSIGFDIHSFNAHHFYTAAYVKACCETDSVPDGSVDFDALPRGLPDEVVVDGDTTDIMADTDEEEMQS